MLKFGHILALGACVAICLMAGAVGGAMTRHFGTSSYTLSYADFVSIMLTAVSLLMTLLAFFIAGLAYIGWQSVTTKVAAEVQAFLDEGFKDGQPLQKMLVEQKDKAMFEGVLKIDEDFGADASEEVKEDDQ